MNPLFPKHGFPVPVLAIAFFVLLPFSCAGSPPVRDVQVPAASSRPAVGTRELERRIHRLINEERRKKGLSELSWNNDLSLIARKHSRDMATRNYFSHNSPEGRGFAFRYREAGYTCAVAADKRIYTGAENLFQNNLYDRVVFVNGAAHYDWNSLDTIAESTVRGWMNSPGHRKNILTPHWRSEGIGIAVSPDDKVYVTQNFC